MEQQRKTITGNVVDETGQPVIGATVIETGTTNGAVTDLDGNFSLEIRSNAEITVTCIGFQTKRSPQAAEQDSPSSSRKTRRFSRKLS